MARVISIGECMVELAKLPAAGADAYRRGFAGDTFNTAWYLRKLLPQQETVSYLTLLGDDRISGDMLAFTEAAALDTSAIRRVTGKTCGLYMISLDGAERVFTYWRETAAARQIATDPAWLSEQIAGADLVYFSGITLAILGRDREAFLDVVRSYRKEGGKVAFDPNIRLRLWESRHVARDALTRAYGVADIALPSFDDEAELFGDADEITTAYRVAALGVDEIVVKNGDRPCLVKHGETSSHVAGSIVRDAVDTTGAGDSFNAGYLVARLGGASVEDAARRGHKIAAEVIRHPGALVPDVSRLG